MQLEIITPDEAVFSGEVKSLVVPGIEGSLGILDNHAPLITGLVAGTVEVRDAENPKSFEIKGGVVEVLKNKVIILAE